MAVSEEFWHKILSRDNHIHLTAHMNMILRDCNLTHHLAAMREWHDTVPNRTRQEEETVPYD